MGQPAGRSPGACMACTGSSEPPLSGRSPADRDVVIASMNLTSLSREIRNPPTRSRHSFNEISLDHETRRSNRPGNATGLIGESALHHDSIYDCY